MRMLLVVAVSLCFSFALHATETEITMIGIVLPGANSTRATELLQRVAISWPPSIGTTIKLANGGANLAMTSTTSGTDHAQLDAAEAAMNALNLRNQYQADIVSPPGGCSLTAPVNLTASLVNTCDPAPWSHYIMTWGDSCPTETDYYQIWKEQPVGSGYVPGWTAPGPFSDVYVTGADANVRAQACKGAQCSALSLTHAFVHAGC
jgi:hypothetical protein